MPINPLITTERTYLCTPDTLAFEQIRKLDSDPEILRYITGGKTRSKAESQDWITKRLAEYKTDGFGLMPAYLKENDAFIGWGGLKHLDQTDKVEVGYRFDKPYWGQGFATEITQAVVKYANEKLGIKQLVAVTDLDNMASQKVLIKCGFDNLGQAHYYNNEVIYFELNL
ncbi:GNAT family N-acetyltransferase [Reichenbachiella sp.]|uniref:GNAT family N-acetyltransferase n=1 Tax=Reichenbachiella sp. TaxID=2184521 RepID=UPI003BB08970